MLSIIRRILACGLVAAVVTAASAISASPAQAQDSYWVEHWDGHTDIVVDWYAVDDVAASPGILSPACDEIADWRFVTWGVVDYTVCMTWSAECADKADTEYHGRAIRIEFSDTGRSCSVIGV